MHLLDIENPEDRALLVQLVREAMAKDQRENPTTSIEFGTVVGLAAQPEQVLAEVLVKMSGDPEGTSIPATNVLPVAPHRGDRVMVLFPPPQGAYIVGSVDDQVTCRAATFYMGQADWGATDRQPLAGSSFSDALMPICGFELNDTDSPDAIVLPAKGVYGACAAVQLIGPAGGSIPNGAHLKLELEIGGEEIAIAEDRMDSGSHATATLSTAVRFFFGERGETVFVTGTGSSVTTCTVNDPGVSFITIWQICCDFEPEFIPEIGGPE